ncbi:hypothetical protein [Tahibacter soli]|uniref:Uncharacterized protein n=1 Tax=Tahibacter soli TaxID=2983605 RepID=A0A9X3YPJ5_9GAMM|nr:hypothetical protein [Tahibacter soli]MDC8016029.1 hypothetical protein [Tahibacter soli]
MPAVDRLPPRSNACRLRRALRAAALGTALAGLATTATAATPLWNAATLATAGDGTLQLRFNVDLLAQLGLAVQSADGRALNGDTLSSDLVARTGVRYTVGGASVAAWHDGEFVAARGFRIVDAQGAPRIDLASLRLRPRAGSTLIDFVGADGRVALTADAVMAALPDGGATLRIDAMDVRLPDGTAIADAQALLRATPPAVPGASSCAVPNWPGSGGGAYVADLALDGISVQAMRCGEPGCEGAACTCDGPGGIDSAVVFAPGAELSNADDDNGGLPCTAADPCSADLPWNAKFSPDRPPYGNDQHPLLVWNLYRLDADGRIAQIGRSGVKHAFVALNIDCACADSQVLGRGCADVYSTNNNDNNNVFGPRSEVVPATVQWGRCGAIDDDEVVAPNPDLGGCDGVKDATGNTRWSHRLAVRESQIDAAAHPGSRWLFEAWYLVRDDVNIDNSMGFIEMVPGWNGAWTAQPAAGTAFRRGAALAAWADPAVDPLARVATVDDALGRLRLATRVRALGGGRWRYDYALMNFTFARSQTAGAEPNLRVVSNAGIAGFAIPLAADVAATSPEFDDGNLDIGDDWTVSRDAADARWLSGSRTLDWGTLARYSFVADAAPVDGTARALLAASADAPSLAFASLVPGPRDPDRVFGDGYEPRIVTQHYTDTFFN